MKEYFGMDFHGRKGIVSHHGVCDACRRLTVLCSYGTGRFLSVLKFPLIPLGNVHILDECPLCGTRGMTSGRKYRKLRKKDLAEMMEGFLVDADNPDTALNGLHTLMVYNEESWFMDLKHSYGRRFETHMQVQLVIAEGLCRFGHYDEAETYCRKAIVLNAGPQAEELLAHCQSLREKKDAARMASLCLRPESMLRPYAFVMAVAASLLITFVSLGLSAMHNHTAWLVNGSDISYSIEIAGKHHQLQPYELKRIKLRIGKHRLQTHGLPGHTEPLSFSYTTSLLRQKLENRALVLNPDAMAVMVAETLSEGHTTNRVWFGKAIHVLAGIDYPFSSFPAWAGSKHSAQTRLFIHRPDRHVEMMGFLRTHGYAGDDIAYARRALAIHPAGAEGEALLRTATRNLTTEQVLSFLDAEKSVSPPLPAWHCFYQNFMEVHRPEHDLQGEYATLCKTYPNQPEYYFLLGRVARNRDTATLFFERSEKGTGSRGLGYHAIAYDLLCSGRFREAQPYAKKALEQSPDDPAFQKLDLQIHLALRQYDAPLRSVRVKREADPGNGEWIAEEIKYLTLLGEHAATTEIMNNFSVNQDGWSAYFQAVRFYAIGNMADYLDNLLRSGREGARLQQLLHAGDVEAARNLINESKDAETAARLILYCAASYHGGLSIAETELAKATAETGATTAAQRAAVLMLSDDAPPSIKQLLELRLAPPEKALHCAALGFKFPARQRAFFNLARKFNTTPEYPHLLLKKWTREVAR